MTNFNFRRLVACICIAFFSLHIFAQSTDYKQLESYFDNLERNDLAHGTISFSKDGKTVYQRALGYQNIETKKEVSLHTRYRIGSISKTFTTVMIMQLVEEGNLKLSTKLNNYFPQIPNAYNITIEHLLRHRSGLNEIVRGDGMEEWIQEEHTKEEVLSQFIKLGSDFKPGEKQEYNNNGFVLLSYILEAIDEKPFHLILKERIAVPLKLNNTYYGDSMGTHKNEAISYIRKENTWEKSTEVHPSMPLGAGGVVSTTLDLNTFFNALFNNRLISKTSLQTMLPPQSSETYGLGLMNYSINDNKAFGHTGGIDGFKSWLVYFPDSKLSIAYTTNAQNKAFKDVVKEAHKHFVNDNKNYELTQIIFEQDSLLFDAAFNTYNANYLRKILMPDFEFYHDKGGLTNTSAESFITSFERNWNKQKTGTKKRLRRELVNESLEVFPLYNFGALQTATHKFFEVESDGSESLMDIAKIVHLWKETEAGWQIARIVSYDHQFQGKHEFSINENFENTIHDLMKKYEVPTVGIGLINDGKITYSKTFGTQSNGEEASSKTIFKVASITKPVVATTVMKLVDMGLWDLDEPLHKYWIDPEIANDPRTKQITTRLILNMQTGLPNWRFQTEKGKLLFKFTPGTDFFYSGEGFEYLRKSIEAKFNKPIEEIVKRVLFNKLDMDNIRFFWDETMDENLYAENYNEEGKRYEIYKYENAMAAGNILACVDDYLKFGDHVLQGAGISNTLFSEMKTPRSSMYKDIVMYGQGWVHVKLSNGKYSLYHGGRDPGVRTIILLFPELNQGLVILTNGDNGDKLYSEILKKLGGKAQDFILILNDAKEKAIALEKMKKE